MRAGKKYAVLTPVLNDWESLSILLGEIAVQASSIGGDWSVFVVDDGSTEPMPQIDMSAFSSASVIRLVRNVGHQQAIGIGICYIFEQQVFDAVIVMDSDGEDRPEELPQLVERSEAYPDRIIFAERTIRSEGLVFRSFYKLYRLAHRVLTGKDIRFGNYSLIPWSRVKNVTSVPEAWTHFASAMIHARIPFSQIPTQRGFRYSGNSRMSLSGLINHGLGALAVHSDIVFSRVILLSIYICATTVLGMIITILVRFLTDFFPKGSATLVTLTLGLSLLVGIFGALSASLFAISFKRSYSFTPLRVYNDLVDSVTEIKPG